MKTDPHAEAAIPLVPYRRAPWVWLLLVAAVLAITWPWAKSFSDAFLRHWDPPFHAWKLEFVARTILSGHLLPHDGNTNMYYPHSGALYFEALHWPQALVAAGLFLFTDNTVLVYHVVLVLFWALAGLCFWMLLLALGATRRAALLGALLFTILPYRISYMVEFNMQLCFGLPLFFFFMVRFFQRPSVRYACGMALAWWLQASSELYQAVFLLIILPFPGLSLLAARWRLLASLRRFWLPALCAAALGGTLTGVFLWPYLTLLDAHEVNRNLQEIATHILEPLSYLRPGGRFHILAPLDVRRDEMIVYPTLALILLAAVHLVLDARRLARIAVPRWVWIFRAIRWSALLLFFALTFAIYFAGSARGVAFVYSLLPVAAAAASLLVLLHPTERDVASLFVTGLFAGAVFAFFLSMGPLLVIRHSLFATGNLLYVWIYEHLGALQGFRVVSRFSIFPMIFMVVAAALAWSRIERRLLVRPALRWLWILPLLAAAAESLPDNRYRLRDVQCPISVPVLDRLDEAGKPYVIAMVPMGNRAYDSCHMLQIARSDRLFVYAWGGAYPLYTRSVRAAMDAANPKPAESARLLRQLWPECYILEDKPLSRLKSRIRYNYAEKYSAETEVFAEDERYALLRLKPETKPSEEHIRLIRHDFLRANPFLTFRARTPAGVPAATLWLDLNGYALGRWEISPDPREFRVAIPTRDFVPVLPNRFRFHADGDAPFFLDAFEPGPAPSEPFPAVEPPAECPPWVAHLHDLPPTAVPLDIRYRNGYALLACEPVETTAAPGGAFRLRHYVQCPRDVAAAIGLSVRNRISAPDGRWMEEGSTLASIGDTNDILQVSLAATGDLNDIRCQAHPAIYALEQTISLPERFGPGDYTLQVVLRDAKGRRLAGRQAGESGKLFPVPIPLRIVAPQAPAGP